ncbi:unnamed protein product, partial [Symbiodinium pilosum]
MGRAERRKGAAHESEDFPDNWAPNIWSQAQVLPGEPGNGPMVYSTDEFLLMQLEQREGEETQCDEKNFETFGDYDYQQGDWNAEHMFRKNERLLVQKRVWRAGVADPGTKVGRNKMGPATEESELSRTLASRLP